VLIKQIPWPNPDNTDIHCSAKEIRSTILQDIQATAALPDDTHFWLDRKC
jgi:hypothetical protein